MPTIKNSNTGPAHTDTILHKTATYLRWLLHHGLEVAHQPQPGRCCRGAAHLDEHPTNPVERWRRKRKAAQDGCPTANTVCHKRERSNSSAPNGAHPALQRRAGSGAGAGKHSAGASTAPAHTDAAPQQRGAHHRGRACDTRAGGNGPGRGDAGRRRGGWSARGRLRTPGPRAPRVGGTAWRWWSTRQRARRGSAGQRRSCCRGEWSGGGVTCRCTLRPIGPGVGVVRLDSFPHPRAQGGHDAAWAMPAGKIGCSLSLFGGVMQHNCSQIRRRGTSDRGRQWTVGQSSARRRPTLQPPVAVCRLSLPPAYPP